MSEQILSGTDAELTAQREKTAIDAILAETGADADPFADGSTAVYEPKAPASPAAAAGANAPGAAQADPFADPGAPTTTADAASETVTVAQADVPVPEEAQGLFGGAFSGLGGLVSMADAGSFGIASMSLAAVGGGGGSDKSSEEQASAGAFEQQNLQSGVSTVAFGLDEGAADTPVEGPAGVAAQVLLNVVPGGDDAGDVTQGRDEYPNFFGFFGPGQGDAQQGYDDSVGQILTTEFNDQLTADLMPIALAIGSIASEQPIFTNNPD